MSKFLNFIKIEEKKTSVYEVINFSNECLGTIKWHPAWRRYCFFTHGLFIFDVTCLNDISLFITNLMSERKNNV